MIRICNKYTFEGDEGMKAERLIKILKNFQDKDVYLNYKDNDDNDNKLVEVIVYEDAIVLKTKLDEEQ
jgi:hydrogenase maturation factor HypF (carbamoyltransferase family)